ncbi:hypothetical protein QZH41_009161 [Actinostola sp. cb2023]|nr:hypothetical protein QZH41_009161 [Actinostola sp. cb2023]
MNDRIISLDLLTFKGFPLFEFKYSFDKNLSVYPKGSFYNMFFFLSEPAKTFRWCAKKNEMAKCSDFVKALPKIANLTGVDIDPKCVEVTDEEDCMKKIKANDADFITLNSKKVYTAGKSYDLVPIVAENTGTSLGYYAVAVAKKDTNITMNNLKGKKTCHTGYGRNAGWNVPIGYLLEKSDFRSGCGSQIDLKSASKYFSQSCVPGVPAGYDNLCAICREKNCKAEKNEYANAFNVTFRCMDAGDGDVAFVKHLTTAAVVGSNMTQNYKYLCTNGKSEVVTAKSHENCNLGFSPSHTVVTRSGDNADYVKILLKAAVVCQPNTAAAMCSGFLIFDSKKYNGKNLLFKDSTKSLHNVGADKNTYKKWLGDGYWKAMDALFKPGPACASSVIFTSYPSLVTTMLVLAKALL